MSEMSEKDEGELMGRMLTTTLMSLIATAIIGILGYVYDGRVLNIGSVLMVITISSGLMVVFLPHPLDFIGKYKSRGRKNPE